MHTIDDTGLQLDTACSAREANSRNRLLTWDDIKARQICRKDGILYLGGQQESQSRVFKYVSDCLKDRYQYSYLNSWSTIESEIDLARMSRILVWHTSSIPGKLSNERRKLLLNTVSSNAAKLPTPIIIPTC